MTRRTHWTGALLALFGFVAALPAAAAAQEEASPDVPDGDEEFLSGGGEEVAPTAAPTGEGEPAPAGGPAGDPGKWGGRLRDHRHQGFVNVLAGTGWYLVAPYQKNDPDRACGFNEKGEGEPVCAGRSGFHLDFLGGFGVTDGIEIFAMFRLGVEQPDERLPETRLIGAGIKVYSPSDGLFKIAFGVAPLFDFSERRVDDAYDFMIHVPIAAHFDFVPWFGAYLQAAPNISFITEFKLDITAGLGVQGRFP